MHKASQGPLKGAVSAQKAIQGSELEMVGVSWRNGREKRFPDEGSLICPPGNNPSVTYLELIRRPSRSLDVAVCVASETLEKQRHPQVWPARPLKSQDTVKNN